MGKQTVLLLVLFQVNAIVLASEPHLIYVYLIWRHCDRAPVHVYPNNVHQERPWPNGFGELTERGLRQHFQLGQSLRERYLNRDPRFLLRDRFHKEIHIRSTNLNRTIVGALVTVAGMFNGEGEPGKQFPHPHDEPLWPSRWTPIPVHTNLDLKHDYVGNPFRLCQRAWKIESDAFHSDDYEQMKAKHKDFLEDLSNKTGSTVKIDRGLIYEYDCHNAEKRHNLSQPDWFTDEVADRLHHIQRSVIEYRYGIAKYFRGNDELQRLRGGALLESVLSKLQAKWRCAYRNDSHCSWYRHLKFDALSAHDITINALLIAMNCEEQVLGKLPTVGFGANLAFELYRIGAKPFVKVLYSKDFSSKPRDITLFVRGCSSTGHFCPLSKFVSAQQSYIPVDIKKECNIDEENVCS